MRLAKTLLAVFSLVFMGLAQAEDGVARSAFTTAIQDREPVDQIGQLSNDVTRVYFFTEVTGMKGYTITHRWEQGGEVRAEVSFNIGGDRWRVYSSKNLQPHWLGEWQVSVVDEGGNVIAQESFAYIPATDSTSESSSEEQVTEEPATPEPPAAPSAVSVE